MLRVSVCEVLCFGGSGGSWDLGLDPADITSGDDNISSFGASSSTAAHAWEIGKHTKNASHCVFSNLKEDEAKAIAVLDQAHL